MPPPSAERLIGKGRPPPLRFNALHPWMGWDDNALRLGRRSQTLSRRTASAGLLLIPSAFTGPGLLTRVALPEPPQLAYPARGVGALWEPRPVAGTPPRGRDRGPRRRTRPFADPAADRTGNPGLHHRTGRPHEALPGRFSPYLTALRAAGLVSAHRAGRSVWYARTSVAESLLAAACP
ncbi:hypothetical protein [Streptomyces sp. NPDC048637]|uniref:hypothetical protein n=1 Tax=Streptomyces sp. NPDC048637 TaxID=3155636 RepID=UPI0034337F21